MNRFVKQLLLWFLIAVLPVQGMAAIFKANCGPRHHAVSVSALATSEVPHEQVHQAHDGHVASDFHHAVEVREKDALSEDGVTSSSSQGVDHYASYCSACAACCTGAVAPPVSLSAVSVPDSMEAPSIPPVISYLGFIPAGLERPPRTYSA